MSSTKLITVEEVAKQLGVSRTTVYEVMDRGELPYVKIGRSRRVSQQAINSYIEANTKGGWAVPSDSQELKLAS